MVVTMPNTKIKPASPAVSPDALQIPVFEEVFPGRVILTGYVNEFVYVTRKAA